MSQERQPYANVRRVQNRCNTIDHHEILKQEIYKQSYDYDTNFRFGFNGPQTMGGAPGQDPTPTASMAGPSGPGVGFEHYLFHFDSLDKDTSSDLVNGEMKWSISTLNNNQDVKNCIKIKVPTLFFPRLQTSEGHPDYFYSRRVYMQIIGMPSTQAILGNNGTQYHFEFEVQNLNSVAVKLVPVWDSFTFQRPITSITEFQVRFMKYPNFRKINIPKDRVTVASVANSNPARFSIVGGDLTTTVLGELGTPASPGIAVYMSGFITGNAAINNAVNSNEGIYITQIINSTTFEVASINLTGIPAANATMLVPKNHIALPIRFTSVRDQLTNYITVNDE